MLVTIREQPFNTTGHGQIWWTSQKQKSTFPVTHVKNIQPPSCLLKKNHPAF